MIHVKIHKPKIKDSNFYELYDNIIIKNIKDVLEYNNITSFYTVDGLYDAFKLPTCKDLYINFIYIPFVYKISDTDYTDSNTGYRIEIICNPKEADRIINNIEPKNVKTQNTIEILDIYKDSKTILLNIPTCKNMLHPMISLVDKEKSKTKEDIEKSSDYRKYYFIDNTPYELIGDKFVIAGYPQLKNVFTNLYIPLCRELKKKINNSEALTKQELIQKIKDVKNPINEQQAFELIYQDPMNLKLVLPPDQTLELCMAAVKQDGLSIKYVAKENLTERICREALNNNIKSLMYIPDEFMESIFEKI